MDFSASVHQFLIGAFHQLIIRIVLEAGLGIRRNDTEANRSSDKALQKNHSSLP
jgi:hypothetical protein